MYSIFLQTITFLLPPLYFVRSGVTDMDLGYSRFAGMAGVVWSQTAENYDSSISASASNFTFNSDGVYASDGPTNRWVARPLRCLENTYVCTFILDYASLSLSNKVL